MNALVVMPLLLFFGGAEGVGAAVCPPSARLQGEAALVASVAALLGDRGVVTEASDCPAILVSLERRHDLLMVSINVGDARTVERPVADVRTAATLISSWARTDVQAPLLAAHDVAEAAAWPAEMAAPTVPSMEVTPGTATTTTAVSAAATVPPGRGVQVFGLAETSVASDGTRWAGGHVGACVMLGPLCAAARVRFAAVVGGTTNWRNDLDRHGAEMLLGADLPLRFGRATLSPGLATGIGWTHTNDDNSPSTGETGGLRAEAHATLSYPFSRRLAFDLAISLDVTQATHVETSSTIPLPNEPRVLGRIGGGMRFGGL